MINAREKRERERNRARVERLEIQFRETRCVYTTRGTTKIDT